MCSTWNYERIPSLQTYHYWRHFLGEGRYRKVLITQWKLPIPDCYHGFPNSRDGKLLKKAVSIRHPRWYQPSPLAHGLIDIIFCCIDTRSFDLRLSICACLIHIVLFERIKSNSRKREDFFDGKPNRLFKEWMFVCWRWVFEILLLL